MAEQVIRVVRQGGFEKCVVITGFKEKLVRECLEDKEVVFVHQEEFEGKEQQVISSIRRLTHPDVIDLEADLGLIAVVGRGMKSTRGTAGRIFSALAHANINVKMIDQGSSELNIIIGVSNDDFEAAIKAIYDIFVETRL